MGWTVDPIEAREAIRKLDPAPQNIGAARQEAGHLVGQQTEAKWGTETGAVSFMSVYRAKLVEASDALAETEKQLAAYLDTVKSAIETFEETDNDVKTAMVLVKWQEKSTINDVAPQEPEKGATNPEPAPEKPAAGAGDSDTDPGDDSGTSIGHI